MTAPQMILVAGPYRSGTDGDPARIAANVEAMTRASLELYRRGHLPVMGEWFALPLIEQALAEGDPADPDTGDLPPDRRGHPRPLRCLSAHRRAVGRGGPDGRHRAAAGQGRLHLAGRDPVSDAGFSKSEMMIVAAARALEGQHVCFVGVGLPNIAVNLAQRTVAPDLEMVYEAGVFGARPQRLPLSIGDPTIVTGSTAVVSMLELFGYYLQGGLIDVGFLGAAQIDRFGNINTTVIGDYAAPTTRLPGSGGACEIAINARQVFVIMRQSARSFVERIDFRTSPGNLGGAEQAERIRRAGGWLGRGPSVVVTDLGIYHFDETGEMRLDSLHPGATLEEVRATIGWEVKVADDLATTPAPTADELRLVREELDPEGVYTR